jgi:signal peptidase I
MAYALGGILWAAASALWIIMLKQSYRSVPRIGFLGWIAVIVINVTLNYTWAGAIRTVVQPFRVPTGAMAPTVQPGDCLFVEKVSTALGQPERGDSIVFKTDGIPSLPPGTCYIKRVAGLPGDRVRIEPPNLIVNDQVVSAPPVFARISSVVPPFAGFQLAFAGMPVGALLTKPADEIVLGRDEFLVLGDNTRNSCDSRYWGAVPRENIVGKAARIYWPLNRIGQSLGKE